MEYDRKCRECNDGRDDAGNPCLTCDGYGYLLTDSGYELIKFLGRRGFSVPMSPQAVEAMNGELEKH